MTRLVQVLCEFDRYAIPRDAATFVEWARELYLAVPEEHRGTATFDITSDGPDDRAQLEFEWWRPETPEDVALRERAAAEREAQIRASRLNAARTLANSLGFDLVERPRP